MTIFFFQAEDGIRDIGVTGVQTCALPISRSSRRARRSPTACSPWARRPRSRGRFRARRRNEIGRASCRERVEIAAGDVLVEIKGSVRGQGQEVRQVVGQELDLEAYAGRSI